MKILFDYKCTSCGHVDEHLVERRESDVLIKCSKCAKGQARRVIATPRIKLEGWSGHFPTAASKWERQHENAAKEQTE